jgi:putative ABC transport system ATP-binding protein
MTFMKIENIRKDYGTGDTTVRALKDVSLDIEKGAYAAITGSSGSGKSTLLTILGAMCVPSQGSVYWGDKNLYSLSEEDRSSFRNENLGFVFQSFHLVPYLTLEENVMLPLAIQDHPKETKQMKARKTLKKVGLNNKFNRLPSEVSGGEQERAAIARAIVHQPSLLLADEPTGNLDSKTGKEIMNLLEELNKDGMTILMVTHSNQWAECATERIQLADGRLLQ